MYRMTRLNLMRYRDTYICLKLFLAFPPFLSNSELFEPELFFSIFQIMYISQIILFFTYSFLQLCLTLTTPFHQVQGLRLGSDHTSAFHDHKTGQLHALSSISIQDLFDLFRIFSGSVPLFCKVCFSVKRSQSIVYKCKQIRSLSNP